MEDRIIKVLTALNKQAKETLKITNELYEKGSEFLVSLLFSLIGIVTLLSLLLYLNVGSLLIALYVFISFFIFFLIGILVYRTIITPKLSQEREISKIDGETEIIQSEIKNLRERNKLREVNELFLKSRLSNVKDVIVEMREIKKLANKMDEIEVADELIEQVYKNFKEEEEKTTILLPKKKQIETNKDLSDNSEKIQLLKEKEKE